MVFYMFMIVTLFYIDHCLICTLSIEKSLIQWGDSLVIMVMVLHFHGTHQRLELSHPIKREADIKHKWLGKWNSFALEMGKCIAKPQWSP